MVTVSSTQTIRFFMLLPQMTCIDCNQPVFLDNSVTSNLTYVKKM